MHCTHDVLPEQESTQGDLPIPAVLDAILLSYHSLAIAYTHNRMSWLDLAAGAERNRTIWVS